MGSCTALGEARDGGTLVDCRCVDAAFARLSVPEISDRGREFLRGLNEILESVLPDFDAPQASGRPLSADAAPIPSAASLC